MIKKGIRISIYLFAAFMGIYMAIIDKGDEFMRAILSIESVYVAISVLISYTLVIIFHELGHFIFGKFNGYKLFKFKLGFLVMELENNKYKLSIEKVEGYYGLCLMAPKKANISRKNYLMYYLGGVAINFLTGIIILFILLSDISLAFNINSFFIILAVLSFVIMFYNLIPFKTLNNPSDGYMILQLIKNTPMSKKLINISTISTKLMMGVRPKDIKEIRKEIVYNDKMDITDIQELIQNLYNAIDNNDKYRIKRNVDIIENIKKSIPSALELGINLELCYCYSILEDIDKAKIYYDKVKFNLEKMNDSTSNRIKAYYEFNFDKNKSLEYAEKGLSKIDSYPVKGLAIMEKELLINIKRRITLKSSNISGFSFKRLNKIMEEVGNVCDKIFVVYIYDGIYPKSEENMIEKLRRYIISEAKVSKWDGTERIITKTNPRAIQYEVICNKESIQILKNYWAESKKGIFSPGSEYDIAFYKEDECYLYTTPHEDYICFNATFYDKLIDEKANKTKKNNIKKDL